MANQPTPTPDLLIRIGAWDVNVTETIESIKTKAGALGQLFGGVDKGAKGASNSVGELFQGLALFSVAQSALAKVQQGGSWLLSQVSEATAYQTQSIAVASDIATNLGENVKMVQGEVLNIQKDIAKQAAALPGVTKDYNDVFNALAGSVSKVFPHDLPRFKDAVEDITKRVGLLAAVNHADPRMGGSAINRAISGTSGLGELFQIDIFQRSPQFISALRAEVAKAGLDMQNWSKTTDAIRLNILRRALKVATPDSLISQFDDTVESLWQGLNDKMFNPLTGMLGVMREIPSLNNTTVMDAVKDVLKGFVAFTNQLAKFADSMGLSVDVMAPVAKFLGWLATLEYMFAGMLEHRDFNPSKLAEGVGNWMNGLISSGLKGLASLDQGTLNTAVATLFQTIPTFLASLINKVNWFDLGRLVSGAIGKLFIAVVASIPGDFGALWNLLWAGIGALFKLLAGSVAGGATVFLIEPLMNLYKSIAGPIGDFFSWLGDGIKSLWDKVRGILDGASRLLNLPGQAVQTIQGAGTSIMNNVSSAVSNVWNAITGNNKDATVGQAQANQAAVATSPIGSAGKLPTLPSVITGPQVGVDKLGAGVGAPLPDIKPGQPVTSHTFAPQVSIDAKGSMLSHDSLSQMVGQHLDRLYSDFKRQKLAHGT